MSTTEQLPTETPRKKFPLREIMVVVVIIAGLFIIVRDITDIFSKDSPSPGKTTQVEPVDPTTFDLAQTQQWNMLTNSWSIITPTERTSDCRYFQTVGLDIGAQEFVEDVGEYVYDEELIKTFFIEKCANIGVPVN